MIKPTNDIELEDWLTSLDYVLKHGGWARAHELVSHLNDRLGLSGATLNTPYINTITASDQPDYPGDLVLERRIRSLIRWNAMAMVMRANLREAGIGGHLATYASAATLYEVGFNHFFRGKDHPCGGDLVFFQGHASPGIYARAFLENRLTHTQLENFRRELAPGGGLSSYPHPWLMPDFWEFPTVSMGLGPLMAIYLARFERYLENRGLKPKTDRKIWAFIGDGETDEPESLGALAIAAREQLDNLIFVVNCNLQRLDGPVRGNGKIIQELETSFRGAGWNVIKLIWGKDWDPLLAIDTDGTLQKRMMETVDGAYQKYAAASGAVIRNDFFGPELKNRVAHLSDQNLRFLSRGGHDTPKVYAAYAAALAHTGSPTVILAKTIKGYGLGESAESRNTSHQQKKLSEAQLREFRTRFALPIDDETVAKVPFYKPAEDDPALEYLRNRRQALGGSLPKRTPVHEALTLPPAELYTEFRQGTNGREVSTTMAAVRIIAKLLRDPNIGKRIVPIVPDEARTFGIDSLFREVGIYAPSGQNYHPVDADHLLYYRESIDGQILEEGITEAGAMASFIASAASYANQGVTTIPFFTFYSMFGFQRVGDLIWAAGDLRGRGFLLGATAGRTTLAGEGLQHQDGHSPITASSYPHVRTYDLAYAYEVATVIQHGLDCLYKNQEDAIYYLLIQNEAYAMPPMPEHCTDGIVKGLYRLPEPIGTQAQIALLGSGAILNEVIKAKEILASVHGITASVFSATSYSELRREALAADADGRVPYVTQLLQNAGERVLAVSDYVTAWPDLIARWIGKPYTVLGTDGFGLSDSREALRAHFGVNADHIVQAALKAML